MEEDVNLNIIKFKPDVVYPLPLQNPAARYEFQTGEDGVKQAIELSNTLQLMMYETKALGLSAPQIGLPYRIFFIRGFESACFNPRLIDISKEEVVDSETTASCPGLIVKIKRPETIRVRWTNAFGDTDTHIYTGLTARVFQRKMDYLDGIKLLDRANKFHRGQAKKEYYREVSGIIT